MNIIFFSLFFCLDSKEPKNQDKNTFPRTSQPIPHIFVGPALRFFTSFRITKQLKALTEVRAFFIYLPRIDHPIHKPKNK